MKVFYQSSLKNILGIFFITVVLFGCNKEFSDVGTGIINDNPFITGTTTVPVDVTHKTVPATQSNNLPVYMLGTFNDPVFGKTEATVVSSVGLSSVAPTFGAKSSDTESDFPEDETVTEVYLEIPFFTNRNDQDNDGVIDAYDVDKTSPDSDSDGDALSDLLETQNGTDPLKKDTDGDGIDDNEDDSTVNPNADIQLYELDSILGNQEANFTLKVQELNYYLRDLDPNQNFEASQYYYSNNTILQNFGGTVLFDDPYAIDDKEIVFYNEDDPDTTDVDESLEVSSRLTPRIRVPLNTAFFQQKIIDKEGSAELGSSINFREYFKGITLSMSNFSDPVMVLLNFAAAEIKIKYTFNTYDTKNTSDTSDDTLNDTLGEATFSVSLSGTIVNSVTQDPYSSAIQTAINQTTNPAQIYLKGGAGIVAEIDLFKGTEGQAILEDLKASDKLINEANLVFYVDQQTLASAGGSTEPDRLYLFNAETNQPLADYSIDMTTNSTSGVDKFVHGGFLEYDDNAEGLLYKIRITEHLNNIIRKDSTNVRLGLAVTSDIQISGLARVLSDPQEYTPAGSAINPLGTVLIGPNPIPQNTDKKLQLEIYYTDPN
ncbi:MAG: DUF4270 family protein [Flavobacteriaceae bacterium]|nr:DUF4270 family protein [Flavobacteriaceae bacterium]